MLEIVGIIYKHYTIQGFSPNLIDLQEKVVANYLNN